MRMKRIRSLQIGSMVLVLGVLASCAQSDEGSSLPAVSETSPPPAVSVLIAEEQEFSREIQSSGLVRGVREVRIVSETEGVIQSSGLELGQAVTEGEVLLSLGEQLQQLGVDEAREAWEGLQLERATTERLFRAGSVSQAELTRARASEIGAELRYRNALKALEDRSIESPISGRIAELGRGLGAGNYLSRGTVIARVVDLSAARLEVPVGQGEIGRISVGDQASVRLATSNEEVDAVVSAIAAGSDEATGSYLVAIEWSTEGQDEALRSGMSASARIEPAEVQRSVAVPSRVIRRDAEGAYVYVVQDERVLLRRIRTGPQQGTSIAVVDGLDAGEQVLASGFASVTDGALVQVSTSGGQS